MVVKKHKERKGKEKKPIEGRKKREKKLRTRESMVTLVKAKRN
jgi:hypothetical protein